MKEAFKRLYQGFGANADQRSMNFSHALAGAGILLAALAYHLMHS